MTTYGSPYGTGFDPPQLPQPLPAKTSSPLPWVALAMSAGALLGVLALLIALLASGVLGAAAEAPLTGQLGSSPSGVLRGDSLARDLSAVISDDGGEVSDLRCPDTPAVSQGVVTLCHGTISGGAWAVAVFFEDSAGRFTALPM